MLSIHASHRTAFEPAWPSNVRLLPLPVISDAVLQTKGREKRRTRRTCSVGNAKATCGVSSCSLRRDLKQQILGIRKRWLASLEVPLHQRNTMAELQLLLDEYQLDFENPEEIRGQDLHEPFIIPVTIDAETQTLDLLIMTKAGALKMVTAADT